MCDCIKQTNELLKEKGLKLATRIIFLMSGEPPRVILPIPVEKIDPKDRKAKLVTLTALYCPFCGALQREGKKE